MNKKESTCTIYLVRHGESEANINGTVQGHTDSPLTENGRAQANELAEELKNINFSAVYSSDLERAKETAEIIKGDRDIEVKILPSLKEKHFGRFEGRPRSEYLEELKDEFYRFDNELNIEERWMHKADPTMESDKELLDRFLSEVRSIASRHLGEKVLIVSHRYAIRMLLLILGQGEHKNLKAGALRPGGYALVECDGSSFRVEGMVGEGE